MDKCFFNYVYNNKNFGQQIKYVVHMMKNILTFGGTAGPEVQGGKLGGTSVM